MTRMMQAKSKAALAQLRVAVTEPGAGTGKQLGLGGQIQDVKPAVVGADVDTVSRDRGR